MKISSRSAAAFLFVVATVCSIAIVSAAVKEPKDAKCPVSGKGCNPDKSVVFDGGKVWFCCGNCEAKFKSDSAPFAAKSHQQMVSTGQLVQTGCPFSGKPVNPATMIDVGGADVGFCCNVCKGKVEAAAGDEQINLVFGNIAKGFAPASK